MGSVWKSGRPLNSVSGCSTNTATGIRWRICADNDIQMGHDHVAKNILFRRQLRRLKINHRLDTYMQHHIVFSHSLDHNHQQWRPYYPNSFPSVFRRQKTSQLRLSSSLRALQRTLRAAFLLQSTSSSAYEHSKAAMIDQSLLTHTKEPSMSTGHLSNWMFLSREPRSTTLVSFLKE